MTRIVWPALICAGTMLGGCQVLPTFGDLSGNKEPTVPTVSEVVTEIQCEIVRAIEAKEDKTLNALRDGSVYVVNVNLTLEVTNNQGINSSLSYIVNPSIFNLLFLPSVSGQQHRDFNVNFTQVFDRSSAGKMDDRKCGEGIALRSDLGIREIIATGLQYTVTGGDSPYKLPVLGVDNKPLGEAAQKLVPSGDVQLPAFGSQVDFTLVYGLGAGPNWTLTNFAGPSGSNGLISGTRTNKDTLILSFARVAPPPEEPLPAAAPAVRHGLLPGTAATVVRGADQDQRIRDAAKSAQDNSLRMILQRLTPR